LKEVLVKLCEIYRFEFSMDLLMTWGDALRDLTPEMLKMGLQQTLKVHLDFIPTPAQFRVYTEDAASKVYGKRRLHEECEACRGTGWKLVPRPDGEGEWATKCDGVSRSPSVLDEVRVIARELYKGYSKLDPAKDAKEIERICRKANIVRYLRMGIDPKWLPKVEVEDARRYV
jgi:hypothetical protein